VVDSYTHGTPVKALTPAQLAQQCAECGGSVWPGGPAYSWQDKAARCHSCKDDIEQGRITTVVPGSSISEWYASERAMWHAEAKKARAVAAGDEDTVEAMERVQSSCLAIRREIIRERIEREFCAA